MTRNEFDLIKTFFENKSFSRPDVLLGIGDDAAIVTTPINSDLVITTDTLVSGVHFSEDALPYDIGYKSLAVNLSDLAAMGATPAWATLALTLPTADESWLKEFSRGFFTLANFYQTQLIGGDTTRGPLSITITAQGFVPHHAAIRRDKAKTGDLIYVTNTLGDAGLALKMQKNEIEIATHLKNRLIEKLNRPEPQIKIGEKLRNIANAAIDISDGLAADLSHILEKSHVGAEINIDHLPLSKSLSSSVSKEDAIELALGAGDDYELCFTVPEHKKSLLESALHSHTYTCIGVITAEPGLKLHDNQGNPYVLKNKGYQHF